MTTMFRELFQKEAFRKELRVLLGAALAAFLLGGLFAVAQAEGNGPTYTIAEIREQTKDGWHEMYEAYGRTIVVDIDIDVPDVDELPVIRVKRADGIVPHDPALKNETSKDEALFVVAESGELVTKKSQASSAAVPLLGTGETQAEYNDMTPAAARAFAENLALAYEPQTGPLDWRLRCQAAYARVYEHDNSTGVTDLSAPLSDHGSYILHYEQWLRDVPIVTGGPSNCVNGPEAHKKGYPRGQMNITLFSPRDYFFNFCPVIEQDVVYADVPLAAFSQAKRAFEGWIKDGRIREVFGLRLGYMVFDDPADVGESFLLVPVWRLLCHYEDLAKFPTFEYDEPGKQFMVESENMRHLVVTAQDGQLLDFINNRRQDRFTAKDILTWDSIK